MEPPWQVCGIAVCLEGGMPMRPSLLVQKCVYPFCPSLTRGKKKEIAGDLGRGGLFGKTQYLLKNTDCKGTCRESDRRSPDYESSGCQGARPWEIGLWSTMNVGNVAQTATFGIQAQNSDLRLLVTPREAAKLLSISERTLYAFTKSGIVPVVRIGRSVRYSLDDLREWIRDRSEKKCEYGQNHT
jgi:excisionase family DNA binding protein